jgi:hypothetical protein
VGGSSLNRHDVERWRMKGLRVMERSREWRVRAVQPKTHVYHMIYYKGAPTGISVVSHCSSSGFTGGPPPSSRSLNRNTIETSSLSGFKSSLSNLEQGIPCTTRVLVPRL